MNANTRSPGTRNSTLRSWARRVAGLTVVVALVLSLAGSVAATSEDDFVVTIPVDTVVTDVGPGTAVLLTDPPARSPSELVGRECTVVARSENQTSVHPNNDLVVETGSSEVRVPDVEAVAGGTVNATDTVVLGANVTVSLIMGPDDVFSAGLMVRIDCAPGATTTTEATTSTTEVSSTDVTTTVPSTSTTGEITTTTMGEGSGTDGTSTTEPSTTSTDDSTTTTVEDEVLPFTGPINGDSMGLMALSLFALGLMVLIGGRAGIWPGIVFWRRRCLECQKEAEFMTPHGRLCLIHTRKTLYEDNDLWVPRRLDGPVPEEWGTT